tara:strand:- start:143 stop:373 length:231 start_codon:yes stop_codon:yes gene_type:complete
LAPACFAALNAFVGCFHFPEALSDMLTCGFVNYFGSVFSVNHSRYRPSLFADPCERPRRMFLMAMKINIILWRVFF